MEVSFLAFCFKGQRFVAGTVTYKADALGKAMGLSDLWAPF